MLECGVGHPCSCDVLLVSTLLLLSCFFFLSFFFKLHNNWESNIYEQHFFLHLQNCLFISPNSRKWSKYYGTALVCFSSQLKHASIYCFDTFITAEPSDGICSPHAVTVGSCSRLPEQCTGPNRKARLRICPQWVAFPTASFLWKIWEENKVRILYGLSAVILSLSCQDLISFTSYFCVQARSFYYLACFGDKCEIVQFFFFFVNSWTAVILVLIIYRWEKLAWTHFRWQSWK